MISVRYGEPKKLSCEQSIFVSFPYKAIIVDVIRGFPWRIYNPKDKSWELPQEALPYLQEKLKEEFKIVGKPIVGEEKKDKVYPLPKKLKTKLYKFQEEDYQVLMNHDRYLLLNQQGLGKEQPLSSKILTQTGWITMGEIKVGDKVAGEDGGFYSVTGVYPQGVKDVYELTFSDGSKCRCGLEHLWTVRSPRGVFKTVTLKYLIDSGLYNSVYNKRDKKTYNNWKWFLPTLHPIKFDNQEELPIDPWIFGMLLGDGSFRNDISISIYEDDLYKRVNKYFTDLGYGLRDGHTDRDNGGDYHIIDMQNRHNRLTTTIKSLCLFNHKSEDKFIPDVYKYSSTENRIRLLQGIFDSDGYISKSNGRTGVVSKGFTISTSSRRLSEDLYFLIKSLGGSCNVGEHETFFTYKGERKQGLNNFEFYFKLPENIIPFTSEKHLRAWDNYKRKTSCYRSLRKVEYIGKEECQCIMVDNPTHLYLTDDFIPTHNTVVSSAAALGRQENNSIKHCLVIACVNGNKYNWKNEIKEHTTSTAMVLGETHKKNISTQDKLDGLDNLDTFFIITNIETLRAKEVLEKMKKLVRSGEIGCIICDEVHLCKNSGSQQGKALLQLAKYVKYFYGLTGTPIMNSPLDTYVPLKLVGGEITSKYQFLARYSIMGGFGGYEVVGFKNLDELQMKLDMVSIRRKKTDVLDLPSKIYIDEYVELGKKQRKIYDDVLKMIMENIDEISLSPDPLGQMIRLRQATADTSILSSTIHESAKIDRLKEIVKEIVDNGDSCLIFSSWTTVTDILERELREYKMAVITGKVKDRERQKKKFMEDDSCHILIGTVAAMGTGLTLTKATTVIFMDEPYTRAAKEQAEDRAHRIGTTSSINIITLMAKDTIDEYIHKLVMKKGVMSDSIVDAKYDVKSKDVIRYMLTGEGNIEKGNVNDTGK
jgi:putative helicase|nr:MAG TPA: Chromatin remodeling complex ATPase [Inoviridae sp.]